MCFPFDYIWCWKIERFERWIFTCEASLVEDGGSTEVEKARRKIRAAHQCGLTIGEENRKIEITLSSSLFSNVSTIETRGVLLFMNMRSELC